VNTLREPDYRKIRNELRRAPRGKLTVYHRGYLYIDRTTNGELDDAARYLLQQAQDGELELFQKRIGYWDYMYFFRVT